MDVVSSSQYNMLSRSAARITRSISKLSRSAASKASSVSTSKATSSPSLPSTSGQSPNYAKTWSTSQRPREDAYSETRFEQTALEFQPQPLSAMEMINAEPVRIVHGRKAVCDGGGCLIWRTRMRPEVISFGLLTD